MSLWKKCAAALIAVAAVCAAIVVAPVVGVGPSGPSSVAQAGECTVPAFDLVCGRIRNADGTGDRLTIGHYGHIDSTGAFYVSPLFSLVSSGNSWQSDVGEPGWADTDGVLIATCWRWRLSLVNDLGVPSVIGYLYAGYHKLSDNQPGWYWRLDGGYKIC